MSAQARAQGVDEAMAVYQSKDAFDPVAKYCSQAHKTSAHHMCGPYAYMSASGEGLGRSRTARHGTAPAHARTYRSWRHRRIWIQTTSNTMVKMTTRTGAY